MARYINEGDLLVKIMDLNLDHVQGDDGRELCQVIQAIPTADVREVISSLWIPVAERLPQKTGWYFATRINQFGHRICQFVHCDNRGRWLDNMGFDTKVLAWLPKLEPYRGDE